MPAYNFKAQFADDVESGRKRQTIRPKRKRPTKVGETLYHYTSMRTKTCRKLLEAECKSVQSLEISMSGLVLDEKSLDYFPDVVNLAIKDGFAGWTEFLLFFMDTYGLSKDNPLKDMALITW